MSQPEITLELAVSKDYNGSGTANYFLKAQSTKQDAMKSFERRINTETVAYTYSQFTSDLNKLLNQIYPERLTSKTEFGQDNYNKIDGLALAVAFSKKEQPDKLVKSVTSYRPQYTQGTTIDFKADFDVMINANEQIFQCYRNVSDVVQPESVITLLGENVGNNNNKRVTITGARHVKGMMPLPSTNVEHKYLVDLFGENSNYGWPTAIPSMHMAISLPDDTSESDKSILKDTLSKCYRATMKGKVYACVIENGPYVNDNNLIIHMYENASHAMLHTITELLGLYTSLISQAMRNAVLLKPVIVQQGLGATFPLNLRMIIGAVIEYMEGPLKDKSLPTILLEIVRGRNVNPQAMNNQLQILQEELYKAERFANDDVFVYKAPFSGNLHSQMLTFSFLIAELRALELTAELDLRDPIRQDIKRQVERRNATEFVTAHRDFSSFVRKLMNSEAHLYHEALPRRVLPMRGSWADTDDEGDELDSVVGAAVNPFVTLDDEEISDEQRITTPEGNTILIDENTKEMFISTSSIRKEIELMKTQIRIANTEIDPTGTTTTQRAIDINSKAQATRRLHQLSIAIKDKEETLVGVKVSIRQAILEYTRQFAFKRAKAILESSKKNTISAIAILRTEILRSLYHI